VGGLLLHCTQKQIALHAVSKLAAQAYSHPMVFKRSHTMNHSSSPISTSRAAFNAAYYRALHCAASAAAHRVASYALCAASQHLARAAHSIDQHGRSQSAAGV
jgi:hypothetical protein